jgi:trehalose-6-phosphatase
MQLMARLGVEKAVFVGDDRTDEDVFVLADPRIVTVRVGRSRRSRAKFFLKKQSEVVRLLRELVSLYRERSRCEPAGQRVAR